MSDELDQLSDAELSAVFAKDVLGREVADGEMRLPDENVGGTSFESWKRIPPYATSADTVLPHLEDCAETATVMRTAVRGEWSVSIVGYRENLRNCVGYAPTLARAACIALIRSKRLGKEFE